MSCMRGLYGSGLGAARGDRFAAFAPSAPNTPEDWVGSTTSVRGKAPMGMTRLPDGTLLAVGYGVIPATAPGAGRPTTTRRPSAWGIFPGSGWAPASG